MKMSTVQAGAFLDAIEFGKAAAYGNSKEKGFWEDQERILSVLDGDDRTYVDDAFVAQKIALMHSELSEGLEGLRKNLPDSHCPEYSSLEVELADNIIRILDLAGCYNLRLGEAIIANMEYNASRPYKHGKKY